MSTNGWVGNTSGRQPTSKWIRESHLCIIQMHIRLSGSGSLLSVVELVPMYSSRRNANLCENRIPLVVFLQSRLDFVVQTATQTAEALSILQRSCMTEFVEEKNHNCRIVLKKCIPNVEISTHT